MSELQPLLELIAKQNEQIIELSKLIADARKPEPVYEPVVERKYPLNVPESEEDARALHEAGMLSDGELEEVLRELEFFTAEITVPRGV